MVKVMVRIVGEENEGLESSSIYILNLISIILRGFPPILFN